SEMRQGLRLAAEKMPSLEGMGSIGGGRLISFSEQWAAGTETHITYVFKDAPDSIRYVGRAKGYGSPEQVLYQRLMKGHHVFEAHPELYAEVLAEHSTLEASKGAESVFHDYYRATGHDLLNATPPLSTAPYKLPTTRGRIEAFFRDW